MQYLSAVYELSVLSMNCMIIEDGEYFKRPSLIPFDEYDENLLLVASAGKMQFETFYSFTSCKALTRIQWVHSHVKPYLASKVERKLDRFSENIITGFLMDRAIRSRDLDSHHLPHPA